MKFLVGMRNLKTALAVFICIIISQLLQLEYPFYAVIATIIAMENSVTNSYTVGKNRMMGTLVGAAIGFVFAWIDPHSAVYSAIGIVIVIYICNLLKWNKSISIASIVFLAIMLNLRPGESPFLYGMHRVADTLIGISVAVLVNYLVFPPDHERSMEQMRSVLRKHLTKLAHELLREGGTIHISPLKKDMANLEKAYETYASEFHLKKNKQQMLEHLEQEIDVYHNTYSHMRMIRLLTDELPTHHHWGLPEQHHSHLMAQLPLDTSSQQIIYNYHVSCILQEMSTLGLLIPSHIAQPFSSSST